MSVYSAVFGGTTIYPSDVTYLALALTADVTLEWPLEASTSNDVVARLIDVTSTAAYAITMPPADQTGTGNTTQFTNLSAYTIPIKDADGGTIAAIASGTSWQVYVVDNSDAAGGWRTLQYGATVSAAQASALAGYGLTATGALLSQSIPATLFNADFTLTDASRATAYVWTGGLGTLTLPSAVTVGSNWFAMARNEGDGNLTLDPPGAETINSASSLVLTPGDSAIVFTDGSDFFTVGLGQDAVFAFDHTSINLAGESGDYTLTGSELNRISYTFTGALAGNVEVVVPATTQQYWITNSTTGGSFTVRFKTSGQTPAILVARDAAAILKCDGTNVSAADTAGIATPVAVADGGTGSTTAGGALINLGGTATGIGIFTAASAAAARSALSAAALGANSDITSLTGLTTPLTAAQGGTGSASYTTGDFLQATGATTLTKLANVATGNVLLSGGVAAASAWGKVGLTTHVSGVLPVANGGTDGLLTVAYGGTGATTLTGVVVGNGASAMTAVAAPSGTIVGTSDTQTLTNKRVTPRAVAASGTSGSITPNGDTTDIYLALGLTGSTAFQIPSGTPTNGQKLLIRAKDDGTGRALTFVTTSGGYRIVGTTLPTTTIANKLIYLGCVYNSVDAFWDVVAVVSQA